MDTSRCFSPSSQGGRVHQAHQHKSRLRSTGGPSPLGIQWEGGRFTPLGLVCGSQVGPHEGVETNEPPLFLGHPYAESPSDQMNSIATDTRTFSKHRDACVLLRMGRQASPKARSVSSRLLASQPPLSALGNTSLCVQHSSATILVSYFLAMGSGEFLTARSFQ